MRATYSSADLALAYELHHEGYCWKLIASCLGLEWETLREAVYRAERRQRAVAASSRRRGAAQAPR